MKKFFFCAAMIAALSMAFVSCGSKNNGGPKFNPGNAPAEIKEMAQNMYNSSSQQNQEGMTYNGLEIVGHDIISTFTMDEGNMDGMTFTQALQAEGMSISEFKQYMKNMILYMVQSLPSSASQNNAYLLRDKEYNLVFRFIGSKSQEKMDVRVEYYEW